MAHIFGEVPYFRCLIRREFTRNMAADAHGYIPAIALAVRCQRGVSLQFQCWLQGEPGAGGMFLVPIQGLCWKPCARPANDVVQPWDVFSPEFGVARMELVHRVRTYVLPERKTGRYLFTIDFTGNALADDAEQHKCLHIIKMDEGWLGAFPNNRLLFEDPAFVMATKERPDFEALGHEFCGE